MDLGAETRASAREPGQSSERSAWPEILAIWALLLVVAIEIVVTYSRLPVHELYHVHRHGLANGAGRAVVFLNFPASLIAIATLPSSYERRPGLWRAVVATAALVLCAFTYFPGVVRQANLDVRPINAAAATGVLLAVLLSLGRQRRRPRLPVVVPALLLIVASPWIAADLGLSFDGVPSRAHYGHHHGMDGALMAISALLVLRVPVRRAALRVATTAYASFLLAWGIANVVNDAWLEQVVKRGWAKTEVPPVLSAHWNWTWTAVFAGAAVLVLVYSSRTRSSIHSDIGT